MKLRLFSLLLTALLLLSLVGCASPKDADKSPDWGLRITAEDITPGGTTLRFTQSGGSPSGELNTGSFFSLEQKSGSKWMAVPYAEGLDESSVGWDSIAWIIPMGGSADFATDWTWLYGELSAGDYRIGKEIMDFRGPGDYDTAMYYTEFTVN